MSKRSFLIFAGLLCAPMANALELDLDGFKVGGYVDGGRFSLKDSLVDGEIVTRMGAKWRIEHEVDENWSVMAELHWLFWRNQASDIGLFHIAGLKFDADLQGVLKYNSGPHLAKLGLYEFKYNPDSKNLGEYLLRSSAYPTLIESSQGKDLLHHSHTRVMGAEYGQNFEMFRHKALVYLEQINPPVNDVSAAYFAAVGPQKAEMELGASYSRFLKTGSPTDDGLVPQERKDYINRQGLTSKAVKLSLRGRLDFGAMLGMEDSFKLYSEAALLGLKNDSLFYKKMSERMPVMVGIDVPTFGLLNTLSFEGEYFKNPYLDKKYLPGDQGGSKISVLPNLPDYSELPNFTRDDMKWSVFIHKALNKWLDVKVRFASDHLRLLTYKGEYQELPLTQRLGDWYFLARIEYHN